jgi:hypothetical protein
MVTPLPHWRHWHQPACPRHHLILQSSHPGQPYQPRHELQWPKRGRLHRHDYWKEALSRISPCMGCNAHVMSLTLPLVLHWLDARGCELTLRLSFTRPTVPFSGYLPDYPAMRDVRFRSVLATCHRCCPVQQLQAPWAPGASASRSHFFSRHIKPYGDPGKLIMRYTRALSYVVFALSHCHPGLASR